MAPADICNFPKLAELGKIFKWGQVRKTVD
jgi:hypothetical protein